MYLIENAIERSDCKGIFMFFVYVYILFPQKILIILFVINGLLRISVNDV